MKQATLTTLATPQTMTKLHVERQTILKGRNVTTVTAVKPTMTLPTTTFVNETLTPNVTTFLSYEFVNVT